MSKKKQQWPIVTILPQNCHGTVEIQQKKCGIICTVVLPTFL